MAHLGMQQAVHQPIVAEATATNAGAHGQVEERGQPLGSTPAPFAQCSGVDVGIEADRHAERPPDGPGYIGLRPARLGCRGDVTIVRRMVIG